MRKLAAFMMLSVDGYFEGTTPWSIDWHSVDEEFNEFAIKQLDANDLLVFGRATFLGMAQYWPSDDAVRNDPEVAGRMNGTPKVVVSKTLEDGEAGWANTRVIRDLGDLSLLKREEGKGMLLLGSSVLTAAVLAAGLLDELRIMVSPVLLGAGNSFAQNPGHLHPLRLLGVRQFRNGNVLLTYAPRPV